MFYKSYSIIAKISLENVLDECIGKYDFLPTFLCSITYLLPSMNFTIFFIAEDIALWKAFQMKIVGGKALSLVS